MPAQCRTVTAHDETASITWAPVQEAAAQTGVSINAVRKWAARDQIRSRAGQGPRGERLEVAVEDVADRAEVVLTDGSRPTSTDLEPLAEQFAQLGALIHQAGQDVAEWRARAEVAETKLRFLGDQLAAARELPEQLRDDLTTARAETVGLRAELVAARDRIVELEQQVRAATRPLFGRRWSAG